MRRLIEHAFWALCPKVEAAEPIPAVLTIQVEMLGTVNMQMAPIKKTMMTVPKDSMPLEANQASLAQVGAGAILTHQYLVTADLGLQGILLHQGAQVHHQVGNSRIQVHRDKARDPGRKAFPESGQDTYCDGKRAQE